MAVARKRRSPVRSKPIRSSSSYGRVRAGVGVALFLLFFAWLWLVNGHWSASAAETVFGASYEVGWSVHLIISAIEVLPVFIAPYLSKGSRFVLLLVWVLSIPFGVWDVFSSAVGLWPYLVRLGLEGDALYLSATATGEGVAFLPERAFIALLVLLHKIYRG